MKKYTVEELMWSKRKLKKVRKLDASQMTFSDNDYKTLEGSPINYGYDEFGRKKGAIVVISINTAPVNKNKKVEYPYPKEWDIYIDSTKIYNKCHIIAYSLSAKIATEDDIFIGTDNLNKKYMSKLEKILYTNIKKGRMYLYKVTLLYRNNSHKIPYAVLQEAVSIDNEKKEKYCYFCYNTQRWKKIDYKNGTITHKIGTFTKEEIENFNKKIGNNKTKRNSQYNDYFIDIKLKKAHLMQRKEKRCITLKDTPDKFIQETTAKYKDLEEEGYPLCKICSKI